MKGYFDTQEGTVGVELISGESFWGEKIYRLLKL